MRMQSSMTLHMRNNCRVRRIHVVSSRPEHHGERDTDCVQKERRQEEEGW